MTTALLPHWEFHGRDWITAVEVVEDQFVFVGSRDGTLWILNRHGSELGNLHLGSWIGALRVLDLRDDEWPQALRGLYLLLGTKSGLVRFLRIDWDEPRAVEWTTVFEFQAANTVREIDVAITSPPLKATVAVGSEDKHVYIVDFAEAILAPSSKDGQARIIKPAVNGWIRSVSFCNAPESDDTLVAAGCGDKNIYFFRLDGSELKHLFVNSKVHSIIADTRGAAIYATSDAKMLYVITRRHDAFRVVHSQPLPHRATRLAFGDNDCRQILAACEDGRIYVFDTRRRELISYMEVGERVFSMKTARIRQTRILMLGLAYGRLVAYMYAMAEGLAPARAAPLRGLFEEQAYEVENVAKFAEMQIYGPKRASIDIGIGRFVHLTRPHPNAPSVAVMGTDGGRVVVIELSPAKPPSIVYQADDPMPARVWAVCAYWDDDTHMTLFVATSDKEIQAWGVVGGAAAMERVSQESLPLRDWPREIRPVENVDRPSDRSLLVACENGDVRTVGGEAPDGSALDFNTHQTLRTGYARRRGGEIQIVTGSDSNLVSMFHGSEPVWDFPTLDRIREVLIHNDECLAVSEDRFLYVLSLRGELKYRYRFPHRALCIDLYLGHGRTLWYVVGCGDGFVYFVDETGWIKDAYQFPDRIRDVRIHENWELVVLCEDGRVYFAPCLDQFVEAYYDGREIELVDRTAQKLRVQASSREGLIAVQEVPDEEKLLLLAYVEYWYETPDSELIVSLIDSSLATVMSRGLVKLYYVYAAALIHLATRVNFSAGKSRIEGFIATGKSNPYALHAIIASIGRLGIHRRQITDWGTSAITLIDSIVSAVPLDDEWILCECVRNLHKSEFFELTSDGFVRFFRTVRIGFGKLKQLLAAASSTTPDAIHHSPVMQLLRLLSQADLERAAFTERYLQLVEGNDEVVRTCLDQWDTARWGLESLADRISDLLDWVLGMVRSGEARTLLKAFVEEYGSAITEGAGALVFAGDLVEERLLQRDAAMTAQEYLCVATACGAMRVLGTTGLKDGRHDVTSSA